MAQTAKTVDQRGAAPEVRLIVYSLGHSLQYCGRIARVVGSPLLRLAAPPSSSETPSRLRLVCRDYSRISLYCLAYAPSIYLRQLGRCEGSYSSALYIRPSRSRLAACRQECLGSETPSAQPHSLIASRAQSGPWSFEPTGRALVLASVQHCPVSAPLTKDPSEGYRTPTSPI